MKIDKATASTKQGLMFYTIHDLPSDYLIITAPIGLSVQIGGFNSIHIRPPQKG